MKIFSGRKKTFLQSSPAVCLAFVALAFFGAGCGKAQKPVAVTPVNSADGANQTETAPAPAPAPTAAAFPAVTTSDGGLDMGELNRCLIRWVVRNRRPPANFEDFASTAGVAIPPPPAGKKYFIARNMHILLVSE
jgi:hypothetical protein